MYRLLLSILLIDSQVRFVFFWVRVKSLEDIVVTHDALDIAP